MKPNSVTITLAVALAALTASSRQARADTTLQRQMVALFDFKVPGMTPRGPTAHTDTTGWNVRGAYQYPRAARYWLTRNGALEITAECCALKDAPATLAYLRDQVGSGGVVSRTLSGVGIGHVVSAANDFAGASIAYGRFVITVYTVNRSAGSSLHGDTPAPIPEMLESIARSVAYSLLRSGLVTDDGAKVLASSRQRPPALVTMNGVRWAPVSSLRAAGAAVSTTDGGLEVRVTHGDRMATVRVYRSGVQVGNNDQELGAPVFVGIDGPMIPVDGIARALGRRATVDAKGLVLR